MTDLEFTSQIAMEQLFSKHQAMSLIKYEFIQANFSDALIEAEIPISFGLDLLVQLVLHKRAGIPVLVAILKKHFELEENPAQACADMILIAAEKDFVDWDEMTQTIVMTYDITQDVKTRMAMLQYPLPMIEEPVPVRNNLQTGYQTISGSIILKDNHHAEDVCLDHINRMNRIPLSLNTDVVSFVQHQWKNLDKPKDGESKEDFRKRVKAFEKYDKSSRGVIKALLAQGDRFWLTHKYDKRGRTYSQGYHISYQGSDWNKACVEFADAEPLNKE